MLKELEYPFESKRIMLKRKLLLRQLTSDENVNKNRIYKKIAILGGATTRDIKDILNLFLLNYGIQAEFYESEYNKYWEDVLFDNSELIGFKPDLIIIHTSSRNITQWPSVKNTAEEVEKLLALQFEHFTSMWDKINATFCCTIIQNNFEQPWFRLFGNKDVSDIRGRLNFVSRLNQLFYKYSQEHQNFFINDINYMASCYGLQKWADPTCWAMYKSAMILDAVPEFAFNLVNIIKSIYGKNKKALVLDMDNTLWGGVVGDDGPENIEIGQETATAELYTEFQEYLKELTAQGIMLNVDSKNDEENALAGLARPDGTLKKDDFICIKANWLPKNENLSAIAKEINIGEDFLVFVDDNPAERHIVREQNPGVAVPEVADENHGVENYIHILDRSGFFEVTNFNSDDLKRNEMYKENAERNKLQASFTNYDEYLDSLEMLAEIKPFCADYMARIAQLTNKSNQFNLTTHRYSQAEIENLAKDEKYITLYGKLIDRFGDNGVVSILIGHKGLPDEMQSALAEKAMVKENATEDSSLNINLWLMSCRVLKRGMENAMRHVLVETAAKKGIKTIYGYYYPTRKNVMVKDHYADMGFIFLYTDGQGNKIYKLDINADKFKNNIHMKIN